MVVDVEYPTKITGADQSVTVITLICPQHHTADQSPVIVGTNANHIQSLIQQCKKNGIDITQTLGIREGRNKLASSDNDTGSEEDDVGCVLWQGSGPLILPPEGERTAVCKVEYKNPVDSSYG